VPLNRRGRLVRGTAAVLLVLPWPGSARATSGCLLDAPALAADLGRACSTVRAAVPGWDGRATVRLEPGDAAVAGESAGRTVLLHEPAWAGLSPQGRQVVLTHELVHVATDRLTTSSTPGWLVEGFADSVALRASGLTDRALTRELRAWVATHGLPTALPTELGTDPVAYEQSWLAVDALVHRYGERAVLRLYRDAGTRPLPEALARLGLTPQQLTALWRAELANRLS
jgi:hypothetical protein